MDKLASADTTATQADLAYEALLAEILECRLAPGAKIIISDVAGRLGFSPGAVREALSRLAAEKWTVATAQKGYSVTPVSADELKDLTRTRITIEQLCLRAAIAGGDVEWETHLVAAYHRLHRIPMMEHQFAREPGMGVRAHHVSRGARRRLRQPVDAHFAIDAVRPERALPALVGGAGSREPRRRCRAQTHPGCLSCPRSRVRLCRDRGSSSTNRRNTFNVAPVSRVRSSIGNAPNRM